MEQAFVALPLIAVFLCFFMNCGGVWANKEKAGFPCWGFSLCVQAMTIWFLFYNTDSLNTIFNGSSPRMPLYDSIMAYGGIGYKVWFWVAVVLCVLFTVMNVIAPWANLDEKKTPG